MSSIKAEYLGKLYITFVFVLNNFDDTSFIAAKVPPDFPTSDRCGRCRNRNERQKVCLRFKINPVNYTSCLLIILISVFLKPNEPFNYPFFVEPNLSVSTVD